MIKIGFNGQQLGDTLPFGEICEIAKKYDMTTCEVWECNVVGSVRRWERGELTFPKVLAQTGLKQATFYNRLREFRAMRGKK